MILVLFTEIEGAIWKSTRLDQEDNVVNTEKNNETIPEQERTEWMITYAEAPALGVNRTSKRTWS